MPYVKPEIRDVLALGGVPFTPGELTYQLTMSCVQYLEHADCGFRQMAEVLGALEATKLEFYRRIAAPYEDTKIVENGDVYSE